MICFINNQLKSPIMNSKTNNTNSQTKSKSKSSKADDSMLEDFFVDELKDIFWAEKHLVKTLPKMEKAATTQELKDAFAEHLETTKEHVSRLEQVFEILGKKAVAKKCEAMEGITKEGEDIITETEKGTATRDVGLIMAGQKVEHYEIATYGGLVQLAKTLSHNDVAKLLEQTLSEEKEADQLLTSVAENNVNYEAAEEVE
jgi:ferritin-like metal-binding protein YciE